MGPDRSVIVAVTFSALTKAFTPALLNQALLPLFVFFCLYDSVINNNKNNLFLLATGLD